MKLEELFNTFLADHVNLNKTRITQLESSVEAVKSAIRRSEWEPDIISFTPQGSWAHETIIKPLPGYEFDADLLVLVKPYSGWTPKDYVNTLVTLLNNLATYSGKVRRFSHCATIEYSGERRIDIAPCIVDRQYKGQFEVCNRGTDEFERSAPTEYTDWIVEKNNYTCHNNLKRVTKLLKYLRDIKGNFTCPSFLFTTLLGEQIYGYEKYQTGFEDLPSALKTIMGRLDDWLQLRPYVPKVLNPKLPSENQAAGWTHNQYTNFRDKINLYREWIDDAYNETDRDESIGKWQRVFGEKFAEREAEEAARISESVSLNGSSIVVAGHYKDLVEIVRAQGGAAIPPRFTKLPHMSRPTWKKSSSPVRAYIDAELQLAEYGPSLRTVNSLDIHKPGYWLKFTAVGSMGHAFTSEFIVKWRVTNTDQVAAEAGALRGQFYESEDPSSRVEQLAYRGVHMVEAFILRSSDRRLAGQSEPFYVVVE